MALGTYILIRIRTHTHTYIPAMKVISKKPGVRWHQRAPGLKKTTDWPTFHLVLVRKKW